MKQRFFQFIVISLCLFTGSGGLLTGASAASAATGAGADSSLPLQELRVFAEIFGRIKSNYVEQVDDKELLENAIRGMVSGLDPHSNYLGVDEFKDLQVGTKGEFGGLGIEVGMEDGFVKVISPIDDTPAQRAGVLSGDLIVRLDDTPVKGLSLNEAVKLMRGKPGSHISLTIVREGEEKPIKIDVVRAVIKVTSVKSRLLDNRFAYVRISQFQSHTGEDLLKAVDRLTDETDDGLMGMVLDLRNNPGGVLNAAVSVSDAFLEEGLIVYTEGREEDSELRFEAAPEDILAGAPMVVLVNEGSASASEIVAGALQDHQRAVIMGSRTFGKGSVQTIIPVNKHAAVKLTTARYFTPSGRSIQAEGIKPDIELQDVQVSKAEQKGVKPLKEADLSGHLQNGNGKKHKPDKSSSKKTDKTKDPLAAKDYQLGEALNLLKGLAILRPAKQAKPTEDLKSMRQRWLLGWLAGLIGVYVPLLAQAETAELQKAPVRIALIIDDLGNHKSAGEAALALPGRVTYAFLPHTPFAWEQANRVHALDREVMLHLPMESDDGNRLGEGALTLAMSKTEFQQTLQDALNSIPHVAGINNHMGSLLTRDPTAMRWLMSAIRDDGLFFIDSRTTKRTVAAKVARRNLIPSARRHVFLDNTPDQRAIHLQWQKLVRKARKTGMAIGIGHPYPQTLEVLAQEIPRLQAQGIELVPVSNLTHDGSILWHASSSPSPRGVKNSKQSPSPIY